MPVAPASRRTAHVSRPSANHRRRAVWDWHADRFCSHTLLVPDCGDAKREVPRMLLSLVVLALVGVVPGLWLLVGYVGGNAFPHPLAPP